MSFKLFEDAVLTTTQLLGEDATYTPVSGSPVQIKAYFNNEYIEVDGVMSLKPTLKIRLSDLPASPRKGDNVVIGSVSYRVLESQADGFGASTLILMR